MKHRILGTAGHIDHGKTTLIGALTGVHTDRLAEEKARGITIELGFADLIEGDVHLGVVDVPGHEGFVRTMVAGATGMDVVLLVVAADEGVMPQTREHLAILDQLRVDRLVVAVTKRDLVEEEWLELVTEEIAEVLESGRFAGAEIHTVSASTGAGVPELRSRLVEIAAEARALPEDDLAALPLDRVFTIRGTGTVVTGTLASGRVSAGDRVRLLPDGLEARVRGVQSHGSEVESAGAGSRVAVALTGDRIDTESVQRGQLLVHEREWPATAMATVWLQVVAETAWRIQDGQRLRLHHGTAEVMARCLLLDGREALEAGESGWAQLRLESPIGARGGDHFVVRSYSPVTTIGGGRIAEPHPPKRRTIDEREAGRLRRLLDATAPAEWVTAALDGAGERGATAAELSVGTGRRPAEVEAALAAIASRVSGGSDGASGAARGSALCTGEGRWIAPVVVAEFVSRMEGEVDRIHREEGYHPVVGRERLRALIGAGAAHGLADTVLAHLLSVGTLEESAGGIRRPGFVAVLTPAQTALRDDFLGQLDSGGLAPPLLDELDEEMRTDPAFLPILRGLESDGRIVRIADGFMASGEAVRAAVADVREALGGSGDLGPGDFREVLGVTRKHLMPILEWMDRERVSVREGDRRSVPLA